MTALATRLPTVLCAACQTGDHSEHRARDIYGPLSAAAACGEHITVQSGGSLVWLRCGCPGEVA